MKTVITYGTFDLLHIGHLNLLERLSDMGDRLIVAVSTDEFNAEKGKNSIFSFADRVRLVEALSCVDQVIPESSWDQKALDIKQHSVDIFGIGDDWAGKFDDLMTQCDVVYLPRTCNISSTELKRSLSQLDRETVARIKHGLDSVLDVIKAIE